MIRADLVRKHQDFYNPGNIHADLESCYEVLRESSFGFVHEVLTYTRRHSDAVSRRAAALMTHRAENVRIHQRFGPHYLSEDEYVRRNGRWLFKTRLVYPYTPPVRPFENLEK